MKWKLTFGQFAVIILTVGAAVIKHDDLNALETIYSSQRIGKMVTAIRGDLNNENLWIFGELPTSRVDQWKEASEGVYTDYSITISKKGGPTEIQTFNLDPLIFVDGAGRLLQMHGTVFRTSDEFPVLEADAPTETIVKQIRLRGYIYPDYDGPDLFAPVEQLITEATAHWSGQIPEGYEVSEVTSMEFHDGGIKTTKFRFNPEEGPVYKDYYSHELNYMQQDEKRRAATAGVTSNYKFTITEQGGSTVIEQFNLQSLDFPDRIVGINNISRTITPDETVVRLLLEFPKLKISVNCDSITKRNGNVQGIYHGPDITFTFEQLMVVVTSSWRDDGPDDRSRITEAEIIHIFLDGNVEITVLFDSNMESVIRDMMSNIDGLVQQLFVKFRTNVKQSAELTDRLKTFLQGVFYDEPEPANESDDDENEPDEGHDEVDADLSHDSGFSDDEPSLDDE